MNATSTPTDPGGRFIEDLVHTLPWWQNIWRQHQSIYRAQAPQAFLRTVAMLTAARIGAGAMTADGRAPDGLPVGATLEFLDSAFATAAAANDADIEKLVGDSFIAQLPSANEIRPDIAPALGPALRAELTRRRASGPVLTPARALIPDLAAASPAMADVLQIHLADWDELLPTGYFADLVRACLGWLQSGDSAQRAAVESVIEGLEAAYGVDYEADEIIATGFVENLPYPDEDGAEMLSMLGPKLRAQYNLARPTFHV